MRDAGMNILICGPYPEPVGGVSVHIQRLSELLNSHGFTVGVCDESRIAKAGVFNLRAGKPVRYIKLLRAADVVHIHSAIGLLRALHVVAATIFRKRVVVTIHSWRKPRLSTKIWGLVLMKTSHKVIFVSLALKEKFAIPDALSVVYPAFLPRLSEADRIPSEILEWVKGQRGRRKKVFASNAFRIVEHEGEDLYGLDTCIEAFSISEVRHHAALVYVVADSSFNEKKLKRYQEEVSKRKLEDSIFLHFGAIDFYALLNIVDGSIRATNTDGDALSVRESLYLGVPCIASDCVDRPEGSILFSSRSSVSLAEKIVATTLDREREVSSSGSLEFFDFYKKIYQGKR